METGKGSGEEVQNPICSFLKLIYKRGSGDICIIAQGMNLKCRSTKDFHKKPRDRVRARRRKCRKLLAAATVDLSFNNEENNPKKKERDLAAFRLG